MRQAGGRAAGVGLYQAGAAAVLHNSPPFDERQVPTGKGLTPCLHAGLPGQETETQQNAHQYQLQSSTEMDRLTPLSPGHGPDTPPDDDGQIPDVHSSGYRPHPPG